MKYDLIVVGAGMAGLIAAAKAREQGLKVLVLAKGQGSLTLSSGAIDLLANSSQIEEYLKNQAEHPYTKVGLKDSLESLKFFQQLTSETGYPYIALEESLKSFYLPTAFGTVKPTYLAPLTMVKGDLRQSGDTLIIGFEELKDFSPSLVAANLQEIRQRHGVKGCCEEVIIKLELSKRSVNAFELASLMDKKESRQVILAKIKDALEARVGEKCNGGKGVNEESKVRVGIPAFLGTAPSLEIFKECETQLQVDLFEIPTLQPSIGGIRLNTLLISHLKKIGVKVLYASPVKGVEAEGRRIKEVLVESAGGRLTSYKTTHLILATGGVYGGGIASIKEGFQERIVNLPLNSAEENTKTTVTFKHTNKPTTIAKFVSGESPAYAKVGVRVNKDLRPLDEACVIYDNLSVVGRILANYDPVVEKSGHGVAIATGYFAAKGIKDQERKGGELDGLR